jgi:hypothetical protein
MEAGVTDRLWSLENMIGMLGQWDAKQKGLSN